MKPPLPFHTFYKLYVSFGVFFLIILVGIGGYMVLEDYTLMDAFYMTVITISTVGYSEVKPLDTAGRIFTSVLILANITTFTYFIAQLSAYFLDGEFINLYKQFRMKDALKDLNGHVIICGYGRNGRESAALLKSRNKEFVVIEKYHDEAAEHEVKYYFHADATHDEILLEAGIQKATALIAALPDDADNLFLVLTARELNPSIRIISRASRDTSVKKLKSAGANNVIMPDKIGGAHMAMLVTNPDISEFLDILASQGNNNNFDIAEVQVGKVNTIGELDAWRKCGTTVLGIKNIDGTYNINPQPDVKLTIGSRLIVMGRTNQVQQLQNLVN